MLASTPQLGEDINPNLGSVNDVNALKIKKKTHFCVRHPLGDTF